MKFQRTHQPMVDAARTVCDNPCRSFDRDYSGTVEKLAGAAGTLFSLLPPENAHGNFVEVVQGMPVRIRFNPAEDPQHLLRPGMSAEPTVKVR
jgi:membrane fusion protein (multidrug efflux system)